MYVYMAPPKFYLALSNFDLTENTTSKFDRCFR